VEYHISVSLKPYNTLRERLVHPKDKPPRAKISDTIYAIECDQQECNVSYIGESSQPLHKRMGQHRRPNTYGQDSAVYLHQKYPGHSFKDDNVKIVDRESDWFGRGVKEAIYERAEAPTLNRRGGLRFHLSGTWDRTVKEAPHIFRLIKTL
jgi:hypothetical protein